MMLPQQEIEFKCLCLRNTDKCIVCRRNLTIADRFYVGGYYYGMYLLNTVLFLKFFSTDWIHFERSNNWVSYAGWRFSFVDKVDQDTVRVIVFASNIGLKWGRLIDSQLIKEDVKNEKSTK